jgi:hypothetical protein
VGTFPPCIIGFHSVIALVVASQLKPVLVSHYNAFTKKKAADEVTFARKLSGCQGPGRAKSDNLNAKPSFYVAGNPKKRATWRLMTMRHVPGICEVKYGICICC